MLKQNELLRYEVVSSWWACYVSFPLGQKLVGKYFAWKIRRKYRRYYNHMKNSAPSP